MIGELSRIIKHTGIYGLGVVLSKSVGFILIPLYTHYLKPADYGTLELLDLILFLAGNFTAMGIFAAVFRFYAAYESEQDKKEVIATALLFNAGVSFLVSAAMMVFAPAIATGAFGSPAYARLVRVASVTLLFSNLTEVPLAYWRAQERTVRFVAVGLVRTLVGGIALVIAIAVLKKGVVGVVYANLISNAIFGLGTSAVVLSAVPRKIVPQKLKEMLKYGLPLVPWGLNMYVLTFSDRFFLRHFGNLAEVGVYALGYKLAMVVTLLVTGPFALLWQWHQFELAKHQEAKTLYARIQLYVLLASLFVGLAVALLAKDVVRLISPASYWAASRIVPLIVMCYVLENIRSVISSGIFVQRVTHRLMVISAVVIPSNLLLNYLFISRYLAMGAAVATLLSYFLTLALCYQAAQRVYWVRYEYGRNAAALGAAALIYLVSRWVDLPLSLSVLVNGSFLLLFVLVAVWLLDPEERSMFQQLGVTLANRMRSVLVRTE
jgi:O-antigen/teichoic acid export membrane protein